MKKVFQLVDLDCANCARKMEEAIARLDGVEQVSVNFLTQKMTLTAADDRFDAILKQAIKACKKVEPDCEIITK
jgi:copper chaperone CopZ